MSTSDAAANRPRTPTASSAVASIMVHVDWNAGSDDRIRLAADLADRFGALLIGLIRKIRKTGVSIIWIEHIVHALTAVVDRVAVLAGGEIIANGASEDVVRDPRVVELYMGIPAGD